MTAADRDHSYTLTEIVAAAGLHYSSAGKGDTGKGDILLFSIIEKSRMSPLPAEPG